MKTISIIAALKLGFILFLVSWGASAKQGLNELKRLKSCNSFVMKECRSLQGNELSACRAAVQKNNAKDCDVSMGAKQKSAVSRGLEKPNISKESVIRGAASITPKE